MYNDHLAQLQYSLTTSLNELFSPKDSLNVHMITRRARLTPLLEKPAVSSAGKQSLKYL